MQRRYRRKPGKDPFQDDLVRPRCMATAKFIIPNGPMVEIRCTRYHGHRGMGGGHAMTLDLLDENNRIIRKADGEPHRLAIKWRGPSDGYGIRRPIEWITYDREKHGIPEEGTFDLKKYLEGRLEP